jgi:hypothetical protein
MSLPRAKRIIAVFGGHEVGDAVLECARALGAAIAAEREILLTGGSGPSTQHPCTVKNQAIDGAIPNAWVGVEGIDRVERWCRSGDRGISVTLPELGARRNYLEALMCDGAVALEGGTRSEVASVLSLRRPVALVGETWKARYEGLRDMLPKTLDALCDDAVGVLATRRTGRSAIDLDSEHLRAALDGPLVLEWFPTGTPAVEIVRWVQRKLLADEDLRGAFPDGVDLSGRAGLPGLARGAVALRRGGCEKASSRGWASA